MSDRSGKPAKGRWWAGADLQRIARPEARPGRGARPKYILGRLKLFAAIPHLYTRNKLEDQLPWPKLYWISL
ncbi:MAG: hypothetical protein JSS73_10770 [Bacteroidetes bacterium]|nr:hypothetical protein [Bacteroidota bacterium]